MTVEFKEQFECLGSNKRVHSFSVPIKKEIKRFNKRENEIKIVEGENNLN